MIFSVVVLMPGLSLVSKRVCQNSLLGDMSFVHGRYVLLLP